MNREDNQREIMVRLFQVSNSLQAYLDHLLKPNSLTFKQFYMMIFIGAFEGDPRIGELSELFGTSRQNVKQVVLKLERQGFVTIYTDEKDSRITRVRMTELAMHFWNNRNQEDDERMKQMFQPLSDIALDDMRTGLMQILTQLELLRNG